MQYTPPIDDLKFGLKYLAGFDEVTSLPAFDHLSLDLAETIIEEAGKLAAEQIAPLNHDADMQSAVRLETGEVRTPDGFADAYKARLKAAGQRWRPLKLMAVSRCRCWSLQR